MRLEYFISIDVHLSLEQYHNAGMPPEETKNIIESVLRLWTWTNNPYVFPSSINRNWAFKCRSEHEAQVMADYIQIALDHSLETKHSKRIAAHGHAVDL